MSKTEEKRGGARVGAGRKTEKDGDLSKFTLLLDAHTIAMFRQKGDGNASLGARRIAKRYKIK